MNKETRYLYVMGPTHVAGAVCFAAIEIPDLDDGAADDRAVAREGQRADGRAKSSQPRPVAAILRFPQALRRLTRRILQRRPLPAGGAA